MSQTKILKVPYTIHGSVEVEVKVDSNGNYDITTVEDALDLIPDEVLIENLERNSIDKRIDGDAVTILSYIEEV